MQDQNMNGGTAMNEERQTQAANRPYETLREGNLSVGLFEKQGKNGPFLQSSGVQKVYTDDQGLVRNTTSLSGSENLRGGHLLIKAHERCNAFKEQMRNQRQAQDRPR